MGIVFLTTVATGTGMAGITAAASRRAAPCRHRDPAGASGDRKQGRRRGEQRRSAEEGLENSHDVTSGSILPASGSGSRPCSMTVAGVDSVSSAPLAQPLNDRVEDRDEDQRQ